MPTVDLTVYLRRLVRQTPIIAAADLERSLAVSGIAITMAELRAACEACGLVSHDDGVHWRYAGAALEEERDQARLRLGQLVAEVLNLADQIRQVTTAGAEDGAHAGDEAHWRKVAIGVAALQRQATRFEAAARGARDYLRQS